MLYCFYEDLVASSVWIHAPNSILFCRTPLLAASPTEVKIGIYDSKPKIYTDNEGKALGLYADIVNFIANKENWKIKYVYGTWEEGLARLHRNEVDIMVDVAFSEERSKQFDFTQEAVLNSWGELYVQKDSPIDSILDLKNKKIAITKSSVYGTESESIEDYLKAFGLNATIIEVDEHIQVLYLVDTGMADAGIVSHIFGLAHQDEFSNLEATKIFLKPTELKFALTKNGQNNKYLIEKLDYWTKELKAGYEDYYDKSLIKHGLAEPQDSLTQETYESCTRACFVSTILGIIGTFVVSGLLFRYSKPLQTIILKRNKKTTNSN